MPLADFLEWMLYEQVEPFGDRRGDVHAGMVSAAIFNQHRTNHNDKFWTPPDFMPKWEAEPEKPPQTVEEQLEMMLLIQQVQNASVGNA